jgi:predicted nucleotidyltransferase
MSVVTRDDILRMLREAKPTLDSFGVGCLWLFGSFARDEGREANRHVRIRPTAA